jgi:protein involved in polysaccharide export with SLBB domain
LFIFDRGDFVARGGVVFDVLSRGTSFRSVAATMELPINLLLGTLLMIATGLSRIRRFSFARVGILTALVGSMVLLTGCGPTKKEKAQLQYFDKAYQLQTSPKGYIINPPDLITVHAPLAPEVDKMSQAIAPDGTISLGDLVQRVYIAGMTAKQAEDTIAERLRAYYNGVKVHIDVDYRSQFYYIFGETNFPGAKKFTGRDTLVRVLADAAPLRTGWPERIYVVHPSPDPDKRHVTVVNMYWLAKRGDTTANVLLSQDDIVYIPLNPLAAVGVAVQNLLFPIEPVVSAASGARGVAF